MTEKFEMFNVQKNGPLPKRKGQQTGVPRRKSLKISITRMQEYLFANDLKMRSGICLGDVLITRNGNTQRLQVQLEIIINNLTIFTNLFREV